MIEVIINNQPQLKIISLVENGKLIEVYNENKKSKKARNEGNIYLGIVKDIIPGMQAAFIDIGTEKNSFIHVKAFFLVISLKHNKRGSFIYPMLRIETFKRGFWCFVMYQKITFPDR